MDQFVEFQEKLRYVGITDDLNKCSGYQVLLKVYKDGLINAYVKVNEKEIMHKEYDNLYWLLQDWEH